MAKLQLQLNGNKGLAPNHYGNSLYLASRPELKYVGSQGQKAEGVYWSERYNGYMSPLPNAYQDVLVIEQDLTNVSDSAIQMAFTDRKDTETSIVFADGDGLYTAQKTPTISGIVDAFNFNDGYSTPVYNREYGASFVFPSQRQLESAWADNLIHATSNYYVAAFATDPNTGDGIFRTFSFNNNLFTEISSFTFSDASNIDDVVMGKISATRYIVAYSDNNENGIVKILDTNTEYDSISEYSDFTFESTEARDISISVLTPTKYIITYKDDNNEYVASTVILTGSTLLEDENLAPGFGVGVIKSTEINSESILSLYNTGGGNPSYLSSFGQLPGVIASENIYESIISGNSTSSVKIDDTHILVQLDGFIKTFSYNGSNFTEIDSVIITDGVNQYTDLIKLSDDYYVFAHRDNAGDGRVKTYSIDGSYNITEEDNFEYDSGLSAYNSIVKIDDTHFAVSYQESGGDGRIRTFGIDGSGTISFINTIEYELGSATFIKIEKVGDYYVVAYRNNGDDLILKSFTINGSYIISEVETLNTGDPSSHFDMVNIDDTYFAVSYRNGLGTFEIKVYSIDISGFFAFVSRSAITGTTATDISITLYGKRKIAVAYKLSNTGRLATLNITESGLITDLTSFEHDTGGSAFNHLITLTDDEIVLSYERGLKSFTFDESLGMKNSYEVSSGSITPTEIIQIDENNYYIIYFDSAALTSYIKTINVDSNLVISETESLDIGSTNISFQKSYLVSGSYLISPFRISSDVYGVKIYSISGTTLTEEKVVVPFANISYSAQIVTDNNNGFIFTYEPSSGTGMDMLHISNISSLISQPLNQIKASDIVDITRSQFAGAISYYYTWGGQIGRASSLANIGTEVDAFNTAYWLYRSNNTGSLPSLRAANPHFVNSKNQYLYILDGESIHGINISISGVTEDIDGTFDPDLITFQSGVILMDGVDYNENIYLSMVEGDTNVDLWNLPNDTSTKTNCYVYIWNKISGQQLQANKIELLDCKHVGRGFAMGGNVYFLTINSANVSEIRILNRGSFEVLHEIGPDNEFNIGKQSVTVTEMGAIIATNKGNLFLLDKGNELKKLGTFATDIDKTSPALVIYGGGEGHEPSNTSQGLHPVVPHLTITYRNTSNENKIKKFYLRNVGTMLNQYKGFTPTTEQQAWLDLNLPELPLVANQGNVYSLVEFLPKLSTLKECVIYCKPTGIITDGEITEIAKIHLYKNQETTPFFTHSVTDKNASRGYLEFNLDTKYVNAVQLEVEYNTTLPIGENDFTPLTGVLEYAPTNSKK